MQIKEIKQELSKTKDTVRDLKSQLKSIQKNNKKENDIELYPNMKALDSSLKLNLNHEPNESHIKNPLNTSDHSQCLETSKTVDSKETNAIEFEIPTSPVIPKYNNIYTYLSDVPEKIGDLTHPSKQKHNHEIIIQKDKPSSFSEVVKNSHKLSANNSIEQQTQTAIPTNTSHSNQSPRNPTSTFSTRQNDPILLLGDSMTKGTKQNLLDRNIFVKKICITRGTINKFLEIIKTIDDLTLYGKILVHLRTNNIKKNNGWTIIKSLEQLFSLIHQKWKNSSIIFSGIMYHKTDSRKNRVINEINDIIKHRADDLNIEFSNNINIVTLPSGHIDPDAYFDNLHLNNQKGVKKFANNIKLKLGLKSIRNEQPIRKQYRDRINPRSNIEKDLTLSYQTERNHQTSRFISTGRLYSTITTQNSPYVIHRSQYPRMIQYNLEHLPNQGNHYNGPINFPQQSAYTNWEPQYNEHFDSDVLSSWV